MTQLLLQTAVRWNDGREDAVKLGDEADLAGSNQNMPLLGSFIQTVLKRKNKYIIRSRIMCFKMFSQIKLFFEVIVLKSKCVHVQVISNKISYKAINFLRNVMLS